MASNAPMPPEEAGPPADELEIRIELRVKFLVLAHQKGVEEALRLWNQAPPEEVLRLWNQAPPKRGRGRPRGPRDPARDTELLMMHDVLVKEDPSLKPPGIGRLIYQAFRAGKEYGTTEYGVTQKIRRLLRNRADYLSNPNALLVQRPDIPTTLNPFHPDWRDK